MTKKILASAAAAALLATGAHSAPASPQPEEARIVFPHRGGIRGFDAVGDRTVYLEGRGDRWYRATLFAPCTQLRFTHSIGIDTNGMASFDRFGSLIVNGERCKLASLVRSAPPPKQRRT